LVLLATGRHGRGLLFSYVAGFAFIGAGGYWLGTLSWFFWFVCAANYGTYFLPYALVPVVLRRAPALPLWAYVPLLATFSEGIRETVGLWGNTWWALGYSQARALPLIQVAEWTGVSGVSLLLLLANSVVADLVLALGRRRGWPAGTGSGPSRRSLILGTSLAVVLPLAVTAAGHSRLETVRRSIQQGPRMVLTQGNITVEDKTRPDFAPRVLARLILVTRPAIDPGVDLVVWPETMPIQPETDQGSGVVRRIAAEVGRPLVLGGMGVSVEEGVTRYANSAFLVSREGEIRGRYDKQALVPFGEYIPLLGRFSWFRLKIGEYLVGEYRGFDPFTRRGTEYALFPLEHGGRDLEFAVLICYEDVLPAMTRRFARQGADFFLVISNENYFGIRELDQHVDIAVFRAIETRRPVLRGANTGRTCIIDPTGRVTHRIDRHVEGTIAAPVPLSGVSSSLPAGPALFGWLCGFAAAGVIGLAVRRSQP